MRNVQCYEDDASEDARAPLGAWMQNVLFYDDDGTCVCARARVHVDVCMRVRARTCVRVCVRVCEVEKRMVPQVVVGWWRYTTYHPSLK